MALPSQEDLVTQQYAQVRRSLENQTRRGQQGLEERLNRQQAITGLQGGAAMKAKEKQLSTFEQEQQGVQAQVGAEEARALQSVAAQREQQAYQTGERESTQQFQSGERQSSELWQTGREVARMAHESLESYLNRAWQSDERVQTQAFQSAEAELGRNFSRSEREAIQAFQSNEALQQRTWQSGERIGAQEWQSLEAQLGRQFTTAEREAVQAFQDQQRQFAQEFQTSERTGTQEFQAGQTELERLFQAQQKNLDRRQQDLQFLDTLNFQKDTFGAEMQYRWSEMDQNVRTNIFNALIASWTSGFRPDDLSTTGFSRYSTIAQLFGGSAQGGYGWGHQWINYNPNNPDFSWREQQQR